MKKIFACVLLVCVICTSFIIPTFAYVDSAGNPGNEGFISNPDYLIVNGAYATTTNYRNIIYLVDQAYSLGLFGGAWPLAIEVKGSGQVRVYCVAPSQNNGYAKRNDLAGWVEWDGAKWDFFTVKNNAVTTQRCCSYLMLKDGSFDPESAYVTSSTIPGMIAYYDSGEWVEAWNADGGAYAPSSGTPLGVISTIAELYRNWLQSPPSTEEAFDNGYNAGRENGFTAGRIEGESIGYENGYDAGVLNGYQTGYEQGDREGYIRGYDEGYLDGSPTKLDIPSIFDAMFDGVQSIFRSVDIEIFGISILGTLVGVLVIAIVAFVIRRLMR